MTTGKVPGKKGRGWPREVGWDAGWSKKVGYHQRVDPEHQGMRPMDILKHLGYLPRHMIIMVIYMSLLFDKALL